MLKIFCDGGARGNPGPAAYGFIVKDKNQTVKEGRGYIGIATNNFAEYTALIEALKWLNRDYQERDLNFYLDSQLVVSQVNGRFKVKSAKIRELLIKVREQEPSFGQITYTYVPRDQNKEADRLVNEALDEQIINFK